MTRVLTRAVFDLLSRQKRAPIAALLIGIIALFPRRRPSREGGGGGGGGSNE